MAEEKTNFKIEDTINAKLTDDTQKNALDFITFLHENDLSLDSNGDGEGWAVGGIVGNSIGFMFINGVAQMPGPWTIWFNSCDFDSSQADDKLKEDTWNHASKCGKCHSGWETCGGGDKTIFGREFERLCHSPLMFTNPDSNTLDSVKRLILMLK